MKTCATRLTTAYEIQKSDPPIAAKYCRYTAQETLSSSSSSPFAGPPAFSFERDDAFDRCDVLDPLRRIRGASGERRAGWE